MGFERDDQKDVSAATDMGNVEGGEELSVNRLSLGRVGSQDSRPVLLELSSRQLGHLRLEFEREAVNHQCMDHRGHRSR